jgi:hypothetical protein
MESLLLDLLLANPPSTQLCFMVMFVYSVLAPIVSLFMVFVFGTSSIVYKRQYVCVYDPSNDTGGSSGPRPCGTLPSA